MIVIGDDEGFVPKIHLTSFDLARTGPLISPNLEILAKLLTVEVIKDDGTLAHITIEPLVLSLNVSIRIVRPSLVRLSSTRKTMKPDTANILSL
jgi:hypothetical protein